MPQNKFNINGRIELLKDGDYFLKPPEIHHFLNDSLGHPKVYELEKASGELELTCTDFSVDRELSIVDGESRKDYEITCEVKFSGERYCSSEKKMRPISEDTFINFDSYQRFSNQDMTIEIKTVLSGSEFERAYFVDSMSQIQIRLPEEEIEDLATNLLSKNKGLLTFKFDLEGYPGLYMPKSYSQDHQGPFNYRLLESYSYISNLSGEEYDALPYDFKKILCLGAYSMGGNFDISLRSTNKQAYSEEKPGWITPMVGSLLGIIGFLGFLAIIGYIFNQ